MPNRNQTSHCAKSTSNKSLSSIVDKFSTYRTMRKDIIADRSTCKQGFSLLRNGLWGLWLSLTLFWGWEGYSAVPMHTIKVGIHQKVQPKRTDLSYA